MKCPVCKEPLPDDSLFCQYCGAKLSQEEEQPEAFPTTEPVIAPEPVAVPEPVDHSEVVLGFVRGSDHSAPVPAPAPEPEAVSEPAPTPAPISPQPHTAPSRPAPATGTEKVWSYTYTGRGTRGEPEAQPPKSKKDFPWISVLVVVLSLCLFATLYYAGTLQTEIKDLTASLTAAETETDELRDQNMTLKRQNNTLKRENDELAGDLQFFAENMGIIVDGDKKTYHRYDCFKVQATSTYEAHNTNYCEWLGYSSCPYCW